MRLLGDRFVIDGVTAIDLATGTPVRLTIEDGCPRAALRERDRVCTELAGIRHPLLLPLVDFGLAAGRWFEAHAAAPPLRASRDVSRSAALHLVRFLHARGLGGDTAAVSGHLRPAIDGPRVAWRPLGVMLVIRSSIDAIRAVMEAHGPPGVTRVTICGPPGSGLRTARLLLARAARLAGFVPVDRHAVQVTPGIAHALEGRHLCVADWLSADDSLPPVLARAAAASNRRHVWIRFRREPPCGSHAAALEPLTVAEMRAMIYRDPCLGPHIEEVDAVTRLANGLPGYAIDALTRVRGERAGALWVHEVAPEYVATPAGTSCLNPNTSADAGVTRLARVVEAARALLARGRHGRAERLLQRACIALAARGATDRAAAAACELGELRLARGRPADAREAFDRARIWARDAGVIRRTLLGAASALRDEARLDEAEAPLRSLLSSEADGVADLRARRLLTDLLLRKGQVDAAWQTIAPLVDPVRASHTCAVSRPADAHALAIGADVCRRRGDVTNALRIAAEAMRRLPADDPASGCEILLSALVIYGMVGHADDVRRCAAGAIREARAARSPVLRVRATALAAAALRACGVEPRRSQTDRLLAAAGKLPPLHAADVRAALTGNSEGDARATHPSAVELLESFTDIAHEAAGEAAALGAIAGRVATILEATSVRVHLAHPRRVVAAHGRAWADERLATHVFDSGAPAWRDGVTAETAEPVRAAGATIGCVTVRWVAGTTPSADRQREVLRVAGAACAPLLRELEPRRVAVAPGPHPDDLLGCGPTADQLREAIRRAALAPFSVLIEGESGSGKELAARAIHVHSSRRGRRLCAVNCAALTEDLLEAELFGHARGAFTGAMTDRAGLFEDADGGTVFLDEVGELSPRAQAKLLRVLQEGEVRRVGESLPRKVDVRIVAATNRRLEHEVDAGRFRADLRFRLDVIRVQIPPLRERPDEIAGLAERIWSEAATRVGTRATLSADLLAALARYDWPGNVRELQNVLAALAVNAPRRGRVPASLLPPHVASLASRAPIDFDGARLDFERRFVRAALARAGGQKRRAAAQLGVSRQGLAKMMKRLGIGE